MSPEKHNHSERAIQIYDELVEELGAPELKLDQIDQLKEHQADESPIDRAARLERYEAVFTEVERLLQQRQLGHELAMHELLADQKQKTHAEESVSRKEDVQAAEEKLDNFDLE